MTINQKREGDQTGARKKGGATGRGGGKTSVDSREIGVGGPGGWYLSLSDVWVRQEWGTFKD